jgi:hypothetical protein
MQQSITTKYIGPSNSKGSRIKAIGRKRDGGLPELSRTISRDCALSIEANHALAAKHLAQDLGWKGLWIAGGNMDNTGYCYVCLEGSYTDGWIDKYINGIEGRDWFLVQDRRY